jgi:hypothetical protein
MVRGGRMRQLASQLSRPAAPAAAAQLVGPVLREPALGLARGQSRGRAAQVTQPPLQSLLGTAALPAHDLAFMLLYPFVVWGADELRRWMLRHRDASGSAGGLAGPAFSEAG